MITLSPAAVCYLAISCRGRSCTTTWSLPAARPAALRQEDCPRGYSAGQNPLLFGRSPFCKVTNGVFDIAEVMRGQRAGLVAAGFPPGLELDLHLREFFRVCSRSACVSTLLDVNRRSGCA